MNEENLKLWNSVCKSNPGDTKAVNFGRAITAIDPYKQVRNATNAFGPAGKGWGWSVERVEYLPSKEIGILVRLWHGDKSNSIDQWGQSSLYINKTETMKDKDCFKKATTDGVTKCLSYLGFNADVFLGKFDDSKYVEELKAEFDKQDDHRRIIDQFYRDLINHDNPTERIVELREKMRLKNVTEDIVNYDQQCSKRFWDKQKEGDK